MKQLSSLLKEKTAILNDTLDLHFYAEFVLNESFKRSYFQITEKYGSYIGQKELIIALAKEIWPTIENNDPEDTFTVSKDELSGFSNIFFNELIITLTNNITCFASNESKYIEHEKLFDKVVIYLSYNDITSYNLLCSCIMHELLHAFNEYQSYIKSSKYLIKDLTNSQSSYNKTIYIGSDVSPENICKRILNNIRLWEQNAYISELSTELENNNFDITKFHNTIDAYKEAKKLFIQSDAYNQYIVLRDSLLYINSSSNKDKQRFANEYNRINETELTYERIYKKLNSVIDKILNKIETKIPKIFYDYYEQQLSSQLTETHQLAHDRKFINRISEYLELLKEYKLQESVKPENNEDWQVFVNDILDETFTEFAKNWKKYPKVGKGWYCGGTVFEIVKIDNNKVYVKEKR